MTQEEIIRMARESGFDSDYFDNVECSCDECNFLKKPLERFAALVAAHEREACAKVCENLYKHLNYDADCQKLWPHTKMINDQYAAAIRARGEK